MAALFARPGVVADLVGGETGGDGHLLRHSKEIGGALVVQRREDLAADIGGEASLRFDGQLIEREMPGSEFEGARQLFAPLFLALIGTGIDQIEAHPIEMALRSGERIHGLARIVEPAEKTQHLVIERLHTEGSAIDACRRKRREFCCLDRRRIGFERDLDSGRETPQAFGFG